MAGPVQRVESEALVRASTDVDQAHAVAIHVVLLESEQAVPLGLAPGESVRF